MIAISSSGTGHAECIKRENFDWVRPRVGRRDTHRHVADEETTEDEGIAEQEDPHHGLAPGHAKHLLVRETNRLTSPCSLGLLRSIVHTASDIRTPQV